jgi:carbon storage regulator
MLVLTRKLDQSIMIGDDIEISVLAVSGEKVRIGINAPREVPVFRKEVYATLGEGERTDGEGAVASGPVEAAPAS